MANAGKEIYRNFKQEIRPILKKYGVKVSDFKEFGYITQDGYIAFGKLRGVYNFTLDDSIEDKLPEDILDKINR